MGKSNKNYRNWLMLCYPDEAYPDWYKRLEQLGCKIAYSPLHENDLWRSGDYMVNNPRCGEIGDLKEFNRNLKFIELLKNWIEKHKEQLQDSAGNIPVDQVYEEGKPKKPHYHIVLQFAGTKSDEQMQQIAASCIAPRPPLPIRCEDIGGSVRYLIHYDNPDKESFNISSITALNGFDVEKYFKPTTVQEDHIFYSIRDLCRNNNIISFFYLMDYLSQQSEEGNYVEEFRYVRSHCNFIKSYVEGKGRFQDRKDIAEFREKQLQLEVERNKAIENLSDTIKRYVKI